MEQELLDIKRSLEIIKSDIDLIKDSLNIRYYNIKKPSIYKMGLCVSKITGVSYKKIHSKRQDRNVIVPRQLICYIARTEYSYTLAAIARHFGKNHGTIHYAVTNMGGLIETDEGVRSFYKKSLELIRNS